jgi:hypothetical protein
VPTYQMTFTNNNDFRVGLYVIPPFLPPGSPLMIVGDLAPHASTTFPIDLPEGTEWVILNSETSARWDRYRTTSDAVQSYVIKDNTYVIKDNTYLTFNNNTASVFSLSSVYSVLPNYNQPHSVGPFSQRTIIWPMSANTEWQIKDAQTGAIKATYFTNLERYQSFTINPSTVVTPVVPSGGTTVVTPIVSHGETISGPMPDNPPLGLNLTPNTPIIVRSGADSIFNSSSFNIDVANLEISIQQRAGLTDKNQRRAAVYAALMAIARTQNRTPKEQVLMDWLAAQVKLTRVEAARLALEEYNKWHIDPWSYKPPAGYDFPAYVLQPARSPMWLTHTPYPPVLANDSWQSLLAGTFSNIPGSYFNNPRFTKV